jgi:hypothetical protein
MTYDMAPIQAIAILNLLPGIAKTLSAGTAKIFAISTFLESPIINLFIPDAVSETVILLSANWRAISLYLTIGPATSCGKNDIYSISFKRLF